MTTRHNRLHHAATSIVLGTGVLLGVDLAAWLLWIAWHLAAVLVPLAVVVVGCRRWAWHRRALAWLRAQRHLSRPSVPQTQVVDDRAKLAQLRAQVDRLEAAANRPIDRITENYERIGRQYGPAGVGRKGAQR
jgi:hypothetical protein